MQCNCDYPSTHADQVNEFRMHQEVMHEGLKGMIVVMWDTSVNILRHNAAGSVDYLTDVKPCHLTPA